MTPDTGPEPFRPAFPWFGGDLQTLRYFITRPRINIPGSAEPLTFEMEDGTGDRLTGILHRPENRTANTRAHNGRPLVLIVHGLTGCSDSTYIRASARHLVAAGWPVLRLTLRGAGPSAGSTRESYHAGRWLDLATVLASLRAQEIAETVAAIGYSLGGNTVLKLAAEEVSGLVAAVSISAPIDLALAAERIVQPRNRLYHRYLLARMREEGLSGDVPGDRAHAIRSARTIIEFDDRVTGPVNGYEGARDYYANCSAKPVLDQVRVPTLVIHAEDDPWIPARLYRDVDWNRSALLKPRVVAKGGHCGFHDRRGQWHDRVTEMFLREVVG